MDRRRADLLLVERGVFPSRARARAAIEAGLVRSGGRLIGRPSDLVPQDAPVEASSPHPYVSRGGLKLAAALDASGIDPAGQVCLDVGASTGGFTDVLLRRGAARVYAVDVGHGQLDPALSSDPRVRSLERLDARRLTAEHVPEPVDLLCMDVSFISVRLVFPELLPHLKPAVQVIVLVKPQFEVGREGVGRGGIVRDDARRQEAAAAVRRDVAALGFEEIAFMPSPVAGGDGNREDLLVLRRG